MKAKAIRLDQPGPAEALHWVDVDVPEPGTREVLIKQRAVGLNYIDIYHRQGLMGIGDFPATLGVEGAGEVVAVGEGCEFGFSVGDKVAYAGPLGGYAQYRTIHERHIIKIPEPVTPEVAAGLMVKGLTAHFLVRRTFIVDERATVLLHAAAGGVGLLVAQWAASVGAKVIGTVGSAEKAELAKANGCAHVLNYKQDNIVEAVQEITKGAGCNVVYDSVGVATFRQSLECLGPFGMMVSYGEASGSVPAVDLNSLQKRGSLFLTRPSLEHYIRDHSEYVVACAALFSEVVDGNLKANIMQSYNLRNVAMAHKDLEQRRTTGSTILFTEA
ncbi:MAG: quinone oxidoreductase [Rickettsiales bacterium]|nr:quinone oxidoreductase [Rickettsiales bacterium]